MKLLFDQNLSPRLVARLRDNYPNASHVSLLGLDQASDQDVWQYACDREKAQGRKIAFALLSLSV